MRPRAASAAVAYIAFLPLAPSLAFPSPRRPPPPRIPAPTRACAPPHPAAPGPRLARPLRLGSQPEGRLLSFQNTIIIGTLGITTTTSPATGPLPRVRGRRPTSLQTPGTSGSPPSSSRSPKTHWPTVAPQPRPALDPHSHPGPPRSPPSAPHCRPTPGTPRGSPQSPPSAPHGRPQGTPRPTNQPLAAPGPPRGTRGVGQWRRACRPQRPRERPAPASTTTPRSSAPLTRLRGRRGSAAERRRGADAAHAVRGRVSRAARPGREGGGGGGGGARAVGCGECGAGGMQARPRRAEAHAGRRCSRGRYCGGVWPRTPPRRLPGWGPRSIALYRGRPLAPGPSGGCGGRRPHERLPPIGSPYPPPPLARPAERQGPLTSRRRGNAILG